MAGFKNVSQGPQASEPAPAAPVASASVVAAPKQGKVEGPQTVQNEFIKMSEVEPAPAGTVPTMVRVGLGVTVNVGNFQSVRVDVSIETPTHPAGAELAYDVSRQWVEDRIKKEILKARKLVPGKDDF